MYKKTNLVVIYGTVDALGSISAVN